MDNLFDPPGIVHHYSAELEQLAFIINSAADAGAQHTFKGLERFREAGDALLKAKEKCGRKWLKWVAANLQFSHDTANRYMNLAKKWDEEKLRSVRNLTDALRLLTEDPTEDTQPCVTESNIEQSPVQSCAETPASVTVEREPGDDTDALLEEAEEESPYVQSVDHHTAALLKIAQECVKRDIPAMEGRVLIAELQSVLKRLRDASLAPVKSGPPRPDKCKHCGADILWVVTAKKGKNMPVNVEPDKRGTFDLRGGVAHYVPFEKGRDWELFRSHIQTCSRRTN